MSAAADDGEARTSMTSLQTMNLRIVLQTLEEVREMLAALSPSERAEVSPAWLARLHAATAPSPWTHGFSIIHREFGATVGSCGFHGPPTTDGIVEIAYGVAPDHQGKGYATEAAQALVDFAFADASIHVVWAHTRPSLSASTRVLTKCGFRRIGEVDHPEDGLVWRWDKHR